MKIRIATYNIHKGVTSLTRRNTLATIRTELDHLDADIVFLQEISAKKSTRRFFTQHQQHASSATNSIDTPVYDYVNQLDVLAHHRYDHAVYGKNASYRNQHHGNAILSRYPILAWHNLDISDHPFEHRGLLHAIARVGTGDVHLLCIHLGLLARSRKRQLDKIIAYIDQTIPVTSPIIIAGDFNDWRRRLHTPLTQALNLQEAWIASENKTIKLPRTFPSRLPWLALDRIYVRHGIIEHSYVARGPIWKSSSDHRPLLADVLINQFI